MQSKSKQALSKGLGDSEELMQTLEAKVFLISNPCSQPGLDKRLALWPFIYSLTLHLAPTYLGPFQSRRKAQRPVPAGRQRHKETVKL